MNYFALGFLAYLCHEMGHVFMAMVLLVPFKGVELRWRGLCIVRSQVGDWRDNAVTAAGILANLALFFITLPTEPWFSFCNLYMAVWNLIPFQGSDGRTIWKRMQSTRSTSPRT